MPSEFAPHWTLDPEINFLNHGSFGACPRQVLAYQSELRDRIERQPVQFFLRDIYDLIDDARRTVGNFLDAPPENLAFVRNATEGVNAILRTIELKAGDEILVTNHGYPACKNVVDFVAGRQNAAVVVVDLDFEGLTRAKVHDQILDQVSDRTRVALIDHVTSPTGVILPVDTLVPELEQRGVMTLVDGAHGPGMLNVSLRTLQPSWYVGNFHKWVCAPKGAGILFARSDRQAGLHPATISHGFSLEGKVPGRSLLHLEFDWTGTHDPTAWLSVPKAIQTIEEMIPGGWPAVRERNRALVLRARNHLASILGVEIPTEDSMIGHLAALPLPPSSDPVSHLYGTPFQDRLVRDFGVEVPIVPWPDPPNRLIRVSAALYNDFEDYRSLGIALQRLLPC